MRLYLDADCVSEDEYAAFVRDLLKEKLSDKQIIYYINVSYRRVITLDEWIDRWTRLNEENKFLMGITDKELEDYITHIDVVGEPVTKKQLKGTWVYQTEKKKHRVSFDSDHSFFTEVRHSDNGHWYYFSGEFTSTLTYSGTWEMKGDSLILITNRDSFAFDLDTSGLVAAEGQQKKLDEWVASTREQTENSYKNRTDEQLRSAHKARLDSSRDKMEWINAAGTILYLKRK